MMDGWWKDDDGDDDDDDDDDNVSLFEVVLGCTADAEATTLLHNTAKIRSPFLQCFMCQLWVNFVYTPVTVIAVK